MPGSVSTSIENKVAHIEFYSEKANSFTRALLKELEAAIRNVSVSQDATQVIVLRSRGDGAFCAGASKTELEQLKDLQSARMLFDGFARVMLAIVQAPQIVICRVHGKVVGGGLGVVGACDYAIAGSEASARLSELDLGLAPLTIAPVLLAKLGKAVFTSMSIDRKWYDPQFLAMRGLYSKIVGTVADLDSQVSQLEQELVALSAQSQTALKRALWQNLDDLRRDMTDGALSSAKLWVERLGHVNTG